MDPPADRVGSAGSRIRSRRVPTDAIGANPRDPAGRGGRVRRRGRAPVASSPLIASRIARALPGSPPPDTATWTPSGPVRPRGHARRTPRRGRRGAPDARHPRPGRRSPVHVPVTGRRVHEPPADGPAGGIRTGTPATRLSCSAPGAVAPAGPAVTSSPRLPGHHVTLPSATRREVLAHRRRDDVHQRPGLDEPSRTAGSHRPAAGHECSAPARSSSSGYAGRAVGLPRPRSCRRSGPSRRPRWPRSGHRSGGTSPRWTASARRRRTRRARRGGSGRRRCR